MSYTVFVSHSNKDALLIDFVGEELKRHDVVPIVAGHVRPTSTPQYIPDKVKALIQGADCVLAFITKNAVASPWVQQEIGYAIDKKPVIPIVEHSIPHDKLAFLQSLEYIPLYWDNLEISVKRLLSWTHQLRIRKEQKTTIELLAVLAISALLIWTVYQSASEG